MIDSGQPLLRDEEVRKQKLSELVRERRSKFPYVEPMTGKISSRWAAFLVVAGNVTGLPILFSLGLYCYNLYLFKNVTPQNLLPIIFIGIPLFVLMDPIIGFIYDRIHRRQKSVVQRIFIIVATVGLLGSQFYLLNQKYTSNEPAGTFNASLGIALVSYSLLNSNSVTNSFQFTPSQKSRKTLLYFEGITQAIAVFFIAGLPFIIKNAQPECDCDESCNTLLADECYTCLKNCQSFLDTTIFHLVSFSCTVVFIILNILSLRLIEHRTDSKDLPPFYSFNKRIFDFFKNQFLASTTFIYLLETLVIFTLVMWVGFYGYRQFNAPIVCTSGDALKLLCTANDYMILLVLLVLGFSVFSAVVNLIDKFNIFWYLSTMFSFAVGVCILVRAGTETTSLFIAVLVATAFGFSQLPTARAYFSDSVYYDEYRTGYVLPQYLAFLFNMAVKIAFIIAIGAIISNTDQQIYETNIQETNRVNMAAGTLVIVGTSCLALMKIRLSGFHLKVFDKIQLAIQRNRGETAIDESITFVDPISHEQIRRPLIPKPHEDIRNMLYLDNFARTSEFIKAYKGKYDILKRDATINFWFGALLSIVGLVVMIVLHEYFVSPVGWCLLVPLLSLVVGIYIVIYAANVRTTASILFSSEAKIDEDYFNKYAFYRKQFEQLKI